jgi:hypothetical protein
MSVNAEQFANLKELSVVLRQQEDDDPMDSIISRLCNGIWSL